MKKVFLLLLAVAINGCWTDQSGRVTRNLAADDVGDTTSYPLIIDGGTKVVYQLGHMTADKGLKLYFDTIPHPAGGLHMDEHLRAQLSGE